MRAFLNLVRRTIRFALASLVWLHAVCVIHTPSPKISALAARLNLNSSETVVFVLLLAFSLLATYGYGRLALDILYIYGFPFVLAYIGIKWIVKGAIAVNRMCEVGSSIKGETAGNSTETLASVFAVADDPQEQRHPINWKKIGQALICPLRRFTLLWCFLLLFTTHKPLLQLALSVVIAHIAFFLFTILKISLFSANVLANGGEWIRNTTEELLAKVLPVTPDSEATQDLKNVWSRITGIKTALLILRNKQLVSRWTAILGAIYLGCLDLYLGLLFSFVYFGIAQVQSIGLSWGTALVTSIFMPFAFSDLPANVWLKLAAGIHCLVIVAVGAGTVLNYLTRRAEELEAAAVALIGRFEDQNIRDRIAILDAKFKAPQVLAPKTADGQVPSSNL